MSVSPVEPARRIKSLDVVRGLAVLGILAVNASYFAMPFQASQNPALMTPDGMDQSSFWSWFVMHVLFEFKMITLFSMLFGASIYMVGGERDDAERGGNLTRRLLWLILFGVIHGALIWYGDILLTYALTGLLVMFARSWKPMTLLIAGVAITAFSALIAIGMGSMMVLVPETQLGPVKATMWAPAPEEIARIVGAYQGGFATALEENFNTWTKFLGYLPIIMLRTAGVMLIGMALFKWGFFSGRLSAWIYGLLAAFGAVALSIVAWQAWMNASAGFPFVHMMGPGQFANYALSPFISLLYASLLILLVKAGALRVLTNALAAAGQMAFTNYLAQSVIMTTLFWGGRGFGLFGELNRAELWGVVVAIWVVELIWSPLWLARYRMGPLEWVWRRLTYKGPVPLSKPAPA